MDAVKYLKEKGGMTNKCLIKCENCQLGFGNNNTDVGCRGLEDSHPEKAVEIVEAWAEEHPLKTRQSEFLRVYPNVEFEDNGIVDIDPCTMDTKQYARGNCKMQYSCSSCRREYWSQEVE